MALRSGAPLRVRLVHWKADEARERITQLRGAGFEVEYDELSTTVMRGLRANPPSALLIDLSRLPSHGREVATAVRSGKATRSIPIVFVGGEPEKVDKMKAVLPDAAYTDWPRLPADVRKAAATRPAAPVVPAAMMDRYAATPLAKKLSLKPGMKVALIDAPGDFERTLGDVPEGVEFADSIRGCQLAIWFVRTSRDLESRIGRMSAATPDGGIWIAYPKKAAGLATDLTQQMVRESGLAHGIVDYKVCAIDATWTGLKFARRKT